MSDLFHKDVPDDFIIKTFKVMNILRQHTFQVLTKRSHRLAEMVSILKFTPNIWMGVSVENADYCYRIKNLAKTNACIKFVSFEPLIGPVGNFFADEIDWVIVGGESGPKSREMQKDWVNSIKTTCVEMKIPFFFKQWGGTNKKKAGRILDGQIWSQFPSK
jgi:protein gp37